MLISFCIKLGAKSYKRNGDKKSCQPTGICSGNSIITLYYFIELEFSILICFLNFLIKISDISDIPLIWMSFPFKVIYIGTCKVF